MTTSELLARRWAAQALAAPEQGGVVATVARLGAVQAQDPKMVLAAVALRCGVRAQAVEAALDAGTVLRTHVLRPTWHLVARDDLRWMTALTADRIRAAARSNQTARGVTADTLSLSERVLTQALASGPQNRDVLVEALKRAGLKMEENLPSHYLMNAEIALLLCSGPRHGGKPTYDLVDRRVPESAPLPRAEALARLAQRYVSGHGPATEKDFSWWAGINLTDARRGLAAAPALQQENWEGRNLWFDPRIEPAAPKGLAWLPAYDEYLIAFADRTAAMDEADAARWITKNGIFHPVALSAGRVVGRWLRPDKPGDPVTVEWFATPPPGAAPALEKLTDWWRWLGGQA